MSIMIDTESVTDIEVREYMTIRGTTIGQMFVEYLKEAIRRDRVGRGLMDKWRETVRKGRGRIQEPYKFNRAKSKNATACSSMTRCFLRRQRPMGAKSSGLRT